MKPSTLLLCVSLVVNAGLLVTLFTAIPHTARDDVYASAHASPALAETSPLPGSTPAIATLAVSASKTPSLWAQLYIDDLDVLITRLKSAGFGYKEIRAIIYEVSGKKFDAAEAELFSDLPKAPYWKRPTYSDESGKEFQSKYRMLMQERMAFSRKYLGGPDSLTEDEDAADYARQQYGPLSIEKLQAVTRIQNDYNDLAAKLSAERFARTNTRSTTEDRQKQRLLNAELERDVQQVLTPEEFAEYQFRESFTAQRLREQFELLRLSETEYKTLFALQRPIDQQFDLWSPDKDEQKAYQEALKILAPQLVAALGPERYADYKQLTESPDDQVTVLMSRLELPLATAGKINVLRDNANTSAKALRNDTALAPAERDIHLTALARETESELSTLLRTPRGYEAYTELKGDWLRALQPKPTSP